MVGWFGPPSPRQKLNMARPQTAPAKGAKADKKEAGHSHPVAEEHTNRFAAITTYLGYAVVILFGHLRDFFGKLTGKSRYFGTNRRPPKVCALQHEFLLL